MSKLENICNLTQLNSWFAQLQLNMHPANLDP